MIDHNNEAVRERVQEVRGNRVKQTDLANLLGLSRAAYQRLESAGNFTWEQLEVLGDFFDISPFFLKYGIYDEEFKEALKDKVIPFSVMQDTKFTVFEDLENNELARVGLFAKIISLEKEDRDRILRHFSPDSPLLD